MDRTDTTIKNKVEGCDLVLQDHWYLVDTHGQKFRLPKTMLFLGREECDVVVCSQSVDKRHAVLTFDLYLNRFKVKDLSTTNGTYVNNSRIPEQEYVNLNHMDSIRLGHDAMMYHVEQGSQITGQGGQLPDPSFVPAWASRHQYHHQHQQYPQPQAGSEQTEPLHVHAHAMAECQGCIAEQHIEHSCSLKHDQSLQDDHIRVSSGSSQFSTSAQQNHSHRQSPQQKLQEPSPSPSLLSSSSSSSIHHQKRTTPSSSEHHSYSPNSENAHLYDDWDHRHQHNESKFSPQQQNQQAGASGSRLRDRQPTSSKTCKDSHSHQRDDHHHHPEDGNSAATRDELGESSVTATSDWSGVGDGEASTPQANSPPASVGPGRNTWPRKRERPVLPHVSDLFSEDADPQQQVHTGSPRGPGSEARPAGQMGGMYFVAFDDSICNGGGDDTVAAAHDVKRRPRRNSQHPLPPELTTVKKGTPLYGQPSWWGEEEKSPAISRTTTDPSGDATPPGTSERREDAKRGAAAAAAAAGHSRPESDCLLPGNNTNSQRTVAEPAHKRVNGERIKPTYMEIPLRDDHAVDVHDDDDEDVSRSSSHSATTTPAKSISSSLSKDSLLDSPNAQQVPTMKASAETATSFTVDFSDPGNPQHKPAKAVTMAGSLSQYVPSKMRKNFKDRQERAGSYSKAGSSSRGSTPSKTSEERELSPVLSSSQQQQQQRKLEEIWSVVECGSKPALQSSRLSSVQATAGTKSSLRSPNLEDIDRLSGEDRTRGQEISSHVPGSSHRKPTSGATLSRVGLVAGVARYPDSTSYLIDKMFEGGSSSSGVGGSAPASSVDGESDVSPEKQMYKEAAANDRTRRSTSSTTPSALAGGKHTGKPPKTATAAAAGTKASSRTAKTGAAAPVSKRRTSSSSGGKAGQPPGSKSKRSAATAAQTAQSERLTAPSPRPKICGNDDSDDDNSAVEEDDLKITEDGETVPAQGAEDGELSDKASEAGTYVIEAGDEGEDEEEEEEARRKIDEVFGVDEPHLSIDPLRRASPGGYDNVYDEEYDETTVAGDELDEINEGEKTPLDGHSPLSDHEDSLDEPTMAATDGVQTWMSQLNALTSGHRQPALSADDRQMSKEDGEASLSRKPPQGGGKRPGTGRKLPSIPTTDRSPVSSEHSSTCIFDPDTAAVVDGQAGWSAASSQRVLNGGHGTNSASRIRGKNSVDNHSTRNGKSSGVLKNGVTVGSHSRKLSSSPSSSARSRGSVDTEILLQDTETVMAAMEARMAYRAAGDVGNEIRGSREDWECNSDTDVSSTVALVNGDEDYVKPSYYTSPRDALSHSTIPTHNDTRRPGGAVPSRGVGVANKTASTTQPAKRVVGRSYSQTATSKTRTPTSATASPRTPTSTSVSTNVQRRSVGSDVYSGRDSVGADSIASDLGSESGTADGSLSRSSSRGKGTITMTKPNRAFHLRRARSDSVEEVAAPTTPRSAKTGISSRTHGSSARSSSVHSTSRTRSGLDTNRSEATSLGAQIARKSRSNGAVMQADTRTSGTQKPSSTTNLHRQDGGRHSLRLTRASSLTISPAQSSTKEATHVSSSSSSKTHALSTPTGSRGNLAITGVSTSGGVGSSRSHSQPGSRSNSPKAAERIAWRRRKEYDPRRAVAEAKAAKVKESSTTGTVTMRPKPHANSRVNRRMIRSASFTNTGGALALSLAGSVSASQELVSVPPSASDYTNEGGAGSLGAFRRAFLPFQAVSGRLGAHSADEDDSLLGSTRAASTSRTSPGSLSVATSEPKSAFTPPPLALHLQPAHRRSPGATGFSRTDFGFPRKGSSSSSSLSLLRRRSLQGELSGYLPLSLPPPRSSGDFDDDGLSLTGSKADGRNQLLNEDPGANVEQDSSVNHQPKTSYDTLIVSSIYQLSMKLASNTDKSLQKLRDQGRASRSSSPSEDFLNNGSCGHGEMTAFRSANQELAGVLNNLRRLERHVQVMNSVLFPEDEVPTRLSAGSLPSPSTPSTTAAVSSTTAGGRRQEKQRYFAEIERIRSELAGFHPIGGGHASVPAPDNASSEADSPEMAELSEQF